MSSSMTKTLAEDEDARAAQREGMGQQDLAERSGLNVVQISHLERGRNEEKISTTLRLANAFGITASELLKSFR